jgi:hypothetical protein
MVCPGSMTLNLTEESGRPLTYAPAAAQQQLTIRSAPASDPHLELLK